MNTEITNIEAVETVEIRTKTMKSGYESKSFLNRKDYGLKYQIKGSVLKMAHKDYRRKLGLMLNQNLSAQIAGGKVLAQRITQNKNGFSVSFVRPEVLESDIAAGTMILSDEERLVIETLRAQLVATTKDLKEKSEGDKLAA